MKQKKLLSVGIILLLALPQLFAQKKSPPVTLNSGDWFETGIRIRNEVRKSDYDLIVRYEVSDKLANGNMAFKVTIERMRLKYADAQNNWWGYDSYYPRYIENRKKNITKQAYEITADDSGKISSVTALSTARKFNYSSISVKTNASFQKEELSSESVFSTVQVKKISETIIGSLITGKAMPKRLRLANADDIVNAVFRSASFALPTNAVIKGNITNLSRKDSIYAVDSEIFRFENNGYFNADVLAGSNPRQRWIFGQFDEFKTFSILLAPLDTLIVTADALDFDNSVSFSGNAAAKASLSKDLVPVFDKQWVNESNYREKSLAEFLSFQKQGQKDFDDVLARYAGHVPSEVLNYSASDFKYVQAGTKLQYFFHNRDQPNSKVSLDEFPKDFFQSIDTLPVSMSGLERGLYYDYFLRWLLSYNQTKLGMVNADQYGFLANYATAMASFEGYPLHFSLYESLKKELHKSEVESTERLKKYYEDFINNCGDTTFTNRVKAEWTEARRWAPGSPSPVKKLFLLDGSTLDLSKFKGKPLVWIVNNNNPDVLKGYIDLIKKQSNSEVHFLIAQRLSSGNRAGIDEILKGLPNVTYVELDYDGNKQENYKLHYLQTKVFTFTSDLKVISSYLFEAEPDEHQVVAEMIDKAIESSVMTKDQKASLLKTIGWSVCSALLTLTVIFFIYRARIANLRKKTLLKNKIKDLEIKAIRSQMNPHFMFNALNSIQSLINNHQYNEANVYLEKFALLMRRVLNNSEKSFVTLSDELDAIKLYCELEQLRFDFKFEIEVAPEVNTQLMEIPGMIIQPLVENSILHGLAQKGNAGRLIIQISCDERYLKVVVIDNGTSLKENEAEGKKSFGLKLVKERLVLLYANGNVGNLHLSSNLGEKESGVTAVLTIPID